MMKFTFFSLMLLVAASGAAQDVGTQRNYFPINITIFSESVGIPNFRNVFKNGNLGVRIGTEFYYKNSENRQLFQSLDIGYYGHKGFQNGFFVSSAFGYRKFWGNVFSDVTVGGGYLLIDSAFPRYKRSGNDFKEVSSIHHKFMPNLGLGLGYQLQDFSLFGRYEVFGEVPFGFKGLPALPHKMLHLGARVLLK